MKLLGYEIIEEGNDEKTGLMNYALKGPKGAYYFMARNNHKPHLMYPVNGRFLSCVRVKGYSWFTDEKGFLEPIN